MSEEANDIQVHFGDCKALLKDADLIPDNSIDAIVSDPPYGLTKEGESWNPEAYERDGQKKDGAVLKGINAIHTAQSILGDAKQNKAFEEWMFDLAGLLDRVLKPGGYVAMFGSSRSIHRVFSGFEDAGYNIRTQLVWVYASSVISKGRHLKRDAKTPEEEVLFMDQHTELRICMEPIMLAQKKCSEKTFAMNMRRWGTGALNIGESSFTQQRYARDEGYFTNNVLVCPSRGEQKFCTQMELEYAHYTGRFLKNWSDTYLIPKPKKNEKMKGDIHPSVKPLNLMEHIIRLTTRKGQKILDPFLGSGTTLVAAQQIQRLGVGIEIEDKYKGAIMDRLTAPAISQKLDAEGQGRMFEAQIDFG